MSRTSVDLMGNRTLGTVLDEHLQRHPDRELIAHLTPEADVVTHTYGQMADLIEDARNRLARLGASDQAVVMSLLPNCTAHYVVWWATSLNGAIHLPLDASSGARHIARLMELATPVVVVATPATTEAVAEAIARYPGEVAVVTIDDLTARSGVSAWRGLPDAAAGSLPSPANNEDVAGLIQTSGTTGVPKLVEVTHANYIFAGESLARATGMLPDDRHFIAMPLFHSGAQFFSTMPALVTGGSVGLVEGFSASRYFEHAVRVGATCGVLLAPPMRMVLNKVLERSSAAPHDTGRMRQVVYAQNLSEGEYDDWLRTLPGVRLLQMYGSTETVALPIGRTPWNDFPLDSMGAPQIERTVRLVDADGNITSSGPGEVCVQGVPGRTLMRGYFRNPEATALALRDGWYHSGDFARCDDRGLFYFEARAQHVMRRGGENVSLPEVELHMQDYPLLRDVVARAVPDPVLEERLVAYVIPREGFQAEAFVAWCQENVGRHGRPDDVVELAEFPRTGVGKVRLNELPLPAEAGRR